MRERLIFLCTAVLSAATPGPAWSADWVRVETPNFVVFGETGEKRTRDVAAEFERFREALGRVVPGAATRAAVPTTVVVFDTRRSFAAYRPMYNGKPVDVGGYFSSASDINRVVLTIEDREQALRTVFHEYVHLVTSNVAQGIPVWLNEGLAEYYSTFLVKDEGRSATLGTVVPQHIALLNDRTLLPLKDLLDVTHESPMYNEGERRGLFYAESWALVHFLIAGEPSRSKELASYGRATAAGMPAAEAWQQSFGNFDPIPDLRRYVKQFSVRGFIYRFPTGIDKVKGDVAPVSGADLEAVFGDALLSVRRDDDAEALLRKSLTRQPASSRGRALLGQLRAKAGQYDEARRLLLEAAADRSDWLTQYHVASGLTEMLGFDRTAEALATADVARAALASVLAVRPDLPHALVMEGVVALATRGDLTGALAGVKRARGLAPGRTDYASLEALLNMQQGHYTAAREILGPLMSGRYPPDVRNRARSLMGQAVTLEKRAADLHAASAGSPPASDASRESQPPAPPVLNEAAAKPVFRVIKEGEERTEGLLERIICAAGSAVLEVRGEGGVLRFSAPRMDAIDFITYRNDLRGGIKCGPRVPPDPVYLTWRRPASPAAGAPASSGLAVAVEFLPM
jgi:tetratricopeptide (TPR) repeat protein